MLTHKETSPLRLLHIVGESRFGGPAKLSCAWGRLPKRRGGKSTFSPTDPVFQQAIRQHGLGLVDLDVIRREIRPVWDLGGLMRLYRFLGRNLTGSCIRTHPKPDSWGGSPRGSRACR